MDSSQVYSFSRNEPIDRFIFSIMVIHDDLALSLYHLQNFDEITGAIRSFYHRPEIIYLGQLFAKLREAFKQFCKWRKIPEIKSYCDKADYEKLWGQISSFIEGEEEGYKNSRNYRHLNHVRNVINHYPDDKDSQYFLEDAISTGLTIQVNDTPENLLSTNFQYGVLSHFVGTFLTRSLDTQEEMTEFLDELSKVTAHFINMIENLANGYLKEREN